MRWTEVRQGIAAAAFVLGAMVCLPATAWAQGNPEEPPPVGARGEQARQDADGNRRVMGGGPVADAAGEEPAEAATAGGPDDYGYTWNNVALNWIDVTKGTDTGMHGNSYDQRVGPVALPFAFKYYAGTYSAVYVAASGYLAFQDAEEWPGQVYVPSPAPPNAVVSPYSTEVNLAASGKKGRVFTLAGGTAPNRFFAVLWNEVQRAGEDELYTFEVVLHENGDIVFQYKTMAYNTDTGWYCGYTGIEDTEGLTGLRYQACDEVATGTAVRFYRPQPTARVSISPRGQGTFTKAGAGEAFRVTLWNNGELGTDTYKVALAAQWTAQVLHGDGSALTDTDGDGAADTGPVGQGQRKELLVRMQTPPVVAVGDNGSATLTVVSTRTPNWQRKTVLRSAVPAPFAQAYENYARMGVRVNAADPEGNRVGRLTDEPSSNGAAIAALPGGGHIVAWGGSSGPQAEVHYVVLDKNGAATTGVRTLKGGAEARGYVFDLGVSVTPDGVIGLAWILEEYRQINEDWQYRDNVFLATLDKEGSPLLAPANLTGYTGFGNGGTPLFSWQYNVRIAAPSAGRFFVAWEENGENEEGWYRSNVFYTVRGATNSVVKPNVQLSSTEQLGRDHAEMPVLAALADGNVLLAYKDFWERADVSYVELGADGSLLRGPATIGADHGYPRAAAQLSNGSILLVWARWAVTGTKLYYAVVDRASYALKTPPVWLENPASATGDDYPAIAADANGRAVVTWGEDDWAYRRFLYYALINGDGALVTPATAFLAAGVPANGKLPRLMTTGDSYSIATNRAFDPASTTLPDVGVAAPGLSTGAPGSMAQLTIGLMNRGLPPATSVVVTAVLDAQLQFVSAVPAPAQVQAADGEGAGGVALTWNLPPLAYLTVGQIVLTTGVPSATIGTTYPVTVSVAHGGADANPANMTVQTQVMAAQQLFTPLVAKSEE
jgi:uncharacterized repeat protein (TIGR01451 family)